MQTSRPVPRYLDEPERILILTIDEVIVATLGLFIAALVFGLFWGLVAGVVLHFVYTNSKKGLSVRRLMGRIYWTFGSGVCGLKRSPDSSIRDMNG